VAGDPSAAGVEEMTTDSLLNVRQVAEFLGMATGTVYHLVSQRRIPVVRLSARCVRFRRTDIETWIAGKVENLELQDFDGRGSGKK
jgi:excisionase family DNA binding protein